MLLIVVASAIVFVLSILRAEKVKSFKANLIVDTILFFTMVFIAVLERITDAKFFCLLILLIWIIIGTTVRKYYPKFEFWLENKICDLFKIPRYKSYEEIYLDRSPHLYAMKLDYYIFEACICALIIFFN